MWSHRTGIQCTAWYYIQSWALFGEKTLLNVAHCVNSCQYMWKELDFTVSFGSSNIIYQHLYKDHCYLIEMISLWGSNDLYPHLSSLGIRIGHKNCIVLLEVLTICSFITKHSILVAQMYSMWWGPKVDCGGLIHRNWIFFYTHTLMIVLMAILRMLSSTNIA